MIVLYRERERESKKFCLSTFYFCTTLKDHLRVFNIQYFNMSHPLHETVVFCEWTFTSPTLIILYNAVLVIYIKWRHCLLIIKKVKTYFYKLC